MTKETKSIIMWAIPLIGVVLLWLFSAGAFTSKIKDSAEVVPVLVKDVTDIKIGLAVINTKVSNIEKHIEKDNTSDQKFKQEMIEGNEKIIKMLKK